MNGFGNALTFKDVNEEDIMTVEAFVRNELLKILSNNASESIGEDCDALVDEQQMLDHFGEAYKEQPENFKFLSGHKKLIRNVAAHVKRLVDGKGENKGLKFFQPKLILPKRAIKSEPKLHTTQDVPTPNVLNEETLTELMPQLKSSLFTKVMECLKQYKVNQQMVIDDVDEGIVSVFIEDGQVYGNIQCIICQNNPKKNKHNQKPKRVSYHTDEISQYWVASNFTTHLKRVHKLRADVQKVELKTDHTADIVQNNQDEILNEMALDESLQIVSAQNVSFPHIKTRDIYDQISSQITAMSKAVLDNNENEDTMKISLPSDKFATIKIVATAPDGNCLFQALSHQLFKYKMQSKEMKSAIKELREKAVTQIQTHIDLYQHELKGHAYDIIEQRKERGEYSDSDSIDIDKEVEFLLYQLLPRNHCWGGSETLKAVSDLYQVNIFVFVENESFHVITDAGAKYERTIAIAFRDGNHYDSVTDIAADDIYALIGAE